MEGEEDVGQENDTCNNVSDDWKNRIDCIASIYIRSNGFLFVRYLTLRWISRPPEYKHISPAYIEATERNHWGRKGNKQRCKGGSGASGEWWGDPRSSEYQFSVEYSSQYNQQGIWTRVSSWGSQATESPYYLSINRWPGSRPQVFNSRPAWNYVSGAPGFGHLVHCEEGGLGCWYARSTGGE